MEKNMQGWFEKAACRGVYSPNTFFPETGRDYAATKEAVAKCKSNCPVQMECLVYGLKEQEGYWGGFNRQERKRIRRKMVARNFSLEQAVEYEKSPTSSIFAKD